MSPIKVSVVIPVYNGEKYINEAINSVLEQSYPIAELLVIDDGSTDSTAKLIGAYDNAIIRPIHKKQNQGLSAARNTGIENATGDYIAFLDADDIWKSEKISHQVKLLKDLPEEFGVVYSGYSCIDDKSNTLDEPIVKPHYRGDIVEALLSGNQISGSGSGVLVKKEVFEKVGTFDTNLKFGEDWDMWIRIAKEFKFDFVSEELVKIRIRDNSMQTSQRAGLDLFYLINNIYIKHNNLLKEKQKKHIRKDFCQALIGDLVNGFVRFDKKFLKKPASNTSEYVDFSKGIKGNIIYYSLCAQSILNLIALKIKLTIKKIWKNN